MPTDSTQTADSTQPSYPSIDEFIQAAAPLNPTYTNADLVQAYQEQFGIDPGPHEARGTLPSFEEFRKAAAPLNPTYSTADLHDRWQEQFGVIGAREKTPGFGESFVEGAKQGYQGLKESVAGFQERQADTDPAKKAAHELGDSFAQEAAKHGVPRDLQEQSFWERVTNPEYLGHLLGATAAGSSPSIGGAVVGGVAGGLVGGPPGAIAGTVLGLGGTAGLQELGSAYRRHLENYKQQGLPEAEAEKKAYTASGISSAVTAVVNALAVPAGLISPATSAVKNFVARSLAEVGIDVADQITGNKVDQLTSKPTQDVTEGVGDTIIGSVGLGAPSTVVGVQAAVRAQRAQPDQGLTPGGLRQNPLPPGTQPSSTSPSSTSPSSTSPSSTSPSSTSSNPIDDAGPVLKAKPDIDSVTDAAKKVVDGVPIDLDELERQTKRKVESEADTQKVVADAVEKQNQMDVDQATLETFKKYTAGRAGDIRVVDADTLPDTAPADKPLTLTKAQFDAFQDIYNLEGKRLVPVTAPNHAGFILPELDQKTAFISVDGRVDPTFVAFHELQHMMQKSEVFDAYRETLLEELHPSAEQNARITHGSHLSKDALFNEIMSDVHGDAMTRESFHAKLIKNLEASQGAEKTQSTLTSFLDQIKGMIAKIKDNLTGSTYKNRQGQPVVDGYVKNLERVHDALAAALAEHYRLRGISVELPSAKAGQEYQGKLGETRVVLHPRAVTTFHELANTRMKGAREAMIKLAQHGTRSFKDTVAITSNLLHYMTSEAHVGHANRALVSQRLNSILYALNRNPSAPTASKPLLKKYADEHAKLPVYNRPQWLAREAAIAIGENKIEASKYYLKELEKLVNSKTFSKEALSYTRDEAGNLRPYLNDVNAEMVIEKGGKEPKYRLADGREVTAKDLEKSRQKPKPTNITTREKPEPKKEVKPSEKEGKKEGLLKDTPPVIPKPDSGSPTPPSYAGKTLKHFTTSEAKRALESGKPFDWSKLPLHGTGSLGDSNKIGRFAGPGKLYLSLDDTVWSKASRYKTGGQKEVLRPGERPGENDSVTYDYDKQAWVVERGAMEQVPTESVEYTLDSDLKVYTIDSPSALDKLKKTYGYVQDETFWDDIAKDYDAVAITNTKEMVNEDRKFWKMAAGDQLIVLHPEKAKVTNAQSTSQSPAPTDSSPGKSVTEPMSEKPIASSDSQAVDYSKIPDTLTVAVSAIEEETGETVRSKESAREALQRVDSSLKKYRQLAECLAS